MRRGKAIQLEATWITPETVRGWRGTGHVSMERGGDP